MKLSTELMDKTFVKYCTQTWTVCNKFEVCGFFMSLLLKINTEEKSFLQH